MKKIMICLIALLSAGSYSFIANGQNDISNIFKAGAADINQFAGGYLKPAGNSFSAGLGSNWYNTAEVNKLWGFSLMINAGVVQAPKSDQTFSLSGFSNLKPVDAGVTEAPSFAGKGNGVEVNLMQPHYLTDGTTVNPLWNNGNGKITTFTTPSGVSQYVPTASIQLTLGVPYGSDVSLRFFPTVKVKGFDASLWGIGIKHNIKQWIPVVKDLPFDAAVVLAYSKFDLKYAFPASAQITPDKLVSGGLQYIPDPNSSDYTTQGMKVSASAETANLVFSKKFMFITPYLGFGLTNTSFDLTMVGNYPTLGDPVASGNTYKMQIKNLTDPIKINPSELMANATLGIRLKVLWIVTVNAQYAFQKYSVASLGIGLTFN